MRSEHQGPISTSKLDSIEFLTLGHQNVQHLVAVIQFRRKGGT